MEEKGGEGSGRTTGTTGRPGRLNKFNRTGPFSPSASHRAQFARGVARMGKKDIGTFDDIGIESKTVQTWDVVGNPTLTSLFNNQREFWNRVEQEKKKAGR